MVEQQRLLNYGADVTTADDWMNLCKRILNMSDKAPREEVTNSHVSSGSNLSQLVSESDSLPGDDVASETWAGITGVEDHTEGNGVPVAAIVGLKCTRGQEPSETSAQDGSSTRSDKEAAQVDRHTSDSRQGGRRCHGSDYTSASLARWKGGRTLPRYVWDPPVAAGDGCDAPRRHLGVNVLPPRSLDEWSGKEAEAYLYYYRLALPTTNTPVVALLDNGACFNFVSETKLNELKRHDQTVQVTHLRKPFRVFTVDGSPIWIRRRVRIVLYALSSSAQKVRVCLQAYVLNMPLDLILGGPFLRQWVERTEWRTGQLRIQGQEIVPTKVPPADWVDDAGGERFLHEEYKLMPHHFRAACWWHGMTPDWDVFASEAQRQVERFTSAHQNAFRQDWSKGQLWLHPPYSMLEEVVRKVEAEGASALLCVPRWEHAGWHQHVSKHSVGRPYAVSGRAFTDLTGRELPEPAWDVEVYRLQGAKRPLVWELDEGSPSTAPVCPKRGRVERLRRRCAGKRAEHMMGLTAMLSHVCLTEEMEPGDELVAAIHLG